MKLNVGLIDADNWGRLNNCFPNIALMKLSAYHKKMVTLWNGVRILNIMM